MGHYGSQKYLFMDRLWLSGKYLVDILGWDKYHLSTTKHTAAKSIIQNNQWNTFRFTETREISTLINQVQIFLDGEVDYMEWYGGQLFSFNKTWQTSRQHYEQIDWCPTIWNK